MSQPAQLPPQPRASPDPRAGPPATELALVRLVLGHPRFRDAATALATELATRLGCERVSLGMRRRGRMRVEALSHSAHFDERSQPLRALSAAMDEACDQDSLVVHPGQGGGPARVVRAHAELARSHGAGAVCTVPMANAGELAGALTFERGRGRGFDAGDVRILEDVVALVGPVLELKRAADASLLDRLRDRTGRLLARLFGPEHPARRLLAAAVALVLLVLAVAPGQHRVKAPATLEGREQRAIVAGIEGYVAEAHARAGDVVQSEELLGRLDDRDLLLEHRRWAGRLQQIDNERREALAGFDRAQLNIVAAKLEQAQAQLALLEENLERTRLVAPFTGVVVQGDLSQSLGSPVQKGQVLFEVAPLDGYRIILEVDERDISYVEPGQSGRLALSALPGDPIPLTVDRVARVATAEEGRNFFRVEARPDHQVLELRPGMEGVAKIEVGRRQLLWIWSHRLVDWLRLWSWSWWP